MMFLQKAMFQTAKQRRPQLLTPQRHLFATKPRPSLSDPRAHQSKYASWAAVAAGVAGLTGVHFYMEHVKKNKETYERKGMKFFQGNQTQTRISQTIGYYSLGIFTTAGTICALRNSYIWASFHPFVTLMGAGAFLLGIKFLGQNPDMEYAYAMKLSCFMAFTGCMGLMLLPILQASTICNIADAALATGLSMASLAYLAYKAPSEQFLQAGSLVVFPFTALLFIGALNLIYPGSMAWRNSMNLLGLALASGQTLMHTQEILKKAKYAEEYDPLDNCIGIYLDTILMLVQILELMSSSKEE